MLLLSCQPSSTYNSENVDFISELRYVKVLYANSFGFEVSRDEHCGMKHTVELGCITLA